MNTEQENLTREIESLKHKIAETSQMVVRLEVSLTRKVSDAEGALDQYLSLLSTLGLFPPLPPPLEDVDLTIELHSAAAGPQGMLTGADIRKVVKPTLNRIAELKRTARADVENDQIRVDDELDQLTLECETVEEEALEVLNKANAINDQADELREVRAARLHACCWLIGFLLIGGAAGGARQQRRSIKTGERPRHGAHCGQGEWRGRQIAPASTTNRVRSILVGRVLDGGLPMRNSQPLGGPPSIGASDSFSHRLAWENSQRLRSGSVARLLTVYWV